MSSYQPSDSPAEPSDSSQSSRPLPLPSRRRDKPQLSCNLCRRRKLKCDRSQPCDTCLCRGLSLSCTYPTLNVSQRSTMGQARHSTSSNVQDRVEQLESLVRSMMGKAGTGKPSDDATATKSGAQRPFSVSTEDEGIENLLSQDSAPIPGSGRISLENAETSYVDSAHWAAILDGIAELKESFQDEPDLPERQETVTRSTIHDGPGLLFGNRQLESIEEILTVLPARPVVDRLVSTCFSRMDVAPVTIHGPTFIKQYERFWERPTDTPVMWIGLLFAIMACGLLYREFSNSDLSQLYQDPPSETRLLIQLYREKVVQCLLLGNYTKSPPYTIETLMLYMHVEYLCSRGNQVALWLIFGLIARLALRMGYHRDGSHFTRLSPFQAEMRRRIWAVVTQLDVTASNQIGLPRMVREADSDTAEPRNLLDEDLSEEMAELPPARPESVQTPVQFFVAKNKLIAILGMISDLTNSKRPLTYSQVMGLDQVLDDTYKKSPQWLHMRPMSQSIMDAPETIMRRVFVALVYYKVKCILHRKYLISARTDNRYAYSRSTCIDTALRLLQCQAMLDEDTQAGGRLYHDRWKTLSFVNQEFLLAISILCLNLDHDINEGAFSTTQSSSRESARRNEIVQALQNSHQIWLRSSDKSPESRKAVKVLQIVLGKAASVERRASPGLEGVVAPTPVPSQAASFEFQPMDADILNTFAEAATESFSLENWNPMYQIQSMDDMIGMSLGFPGNYEFSSEDAGGQL